MLLRLEIEFNCVNFVKKTKRTAGHRLALEGSEAPQQADTVLEEQMHLFNSRGPRSQSKSVSVACFSI